MLLIGQSPNSGTCLGGNSENSAGNIISMHYTKCNLDSFNNNISIMNFDNFHSFDDSNQIS